MGGWRLGNGRVGQPREENFSQPALTSLSGAVSKLGNEKKKNPSLEPIKPRKEGWLAVVFSSFFSLGFPGLRPNAEG